MRWRRWNWLNNLLLPLLLAVLRTCWLWPWLELARRALAPSQPGQVLPLPLMIGLFLAGLTTARLALRDTNPIALARIGVTGIGLAAILALLWWQFYHFQYPLWDGRWLKELSLALTHWSQEVPLPFLTLLAIVYLWWQSVRDGGKPLLRDDLWAAFAVGFLGLALFVMIAAAAGITSIDAGSLMIPFFAAGLAAMALAHLKSTHQRQDEIHLPPNRYWFISVGSVIAGLLGVGLALSVLITPGMLAQSLRWTMYLLDILGQAFYYALLVFSYLIFLILIPLIAWFRAFVLAGGDPPEPIQTSDFAGQLKDLPKGTLTFSPILGESLSWIGLAVLILGIGLVFVLAVRRFRAGVEEGVEETRELVFSRELLLEQLAALRRRWWGRIGYRAAGRFSPFLSLDDEIPARRMVRSVYQALLLAAKEQGQPRQPSQTPREYQRKLAEVLPDEQHGLNTMTDGYLQARYGPDPPAPEQVDRIVQAWAKLRTTWETRTGQKSE